MSSIHPIYKDQTVDAVSILAVCAVAVNRAVSILWITRYGRTAVVPTGIPSS